jgi:hypothetical protein
MSRYRDPIAQVQSYLGLNSQNLGLSGRFHCTNCFQPFTKLFTHILMTVWLGKGIKDCYQTKKDGR